MKAHLQIHTSLTFHKMLAQDSLKKHLKIKTKKNPAHCADCAKRQEVSESGKSDVVHNHLRALQLFKYFTIIISAMGQRMSALIISWLLTSYAIISILFCLFYLRSCLMSINIKPLLIRKKNYSSDLFFVSLYTSNEN